MIWIALGVGIVVGAVVMFFLLRYLLSEAVILPW